MKQSVKNGLLSKVEDDTRLDQGELKHLDSVMEDPTERAKILVAPQRPHYLRRKSMEGIVVGRVFELKAKFDALTALKKI